jgi:hypothetical protein
MRMSRVVDRTGPGRDFGAWLTTLRSKLSRCFMRNEALSVILTTFRAMTCSTEFEEKSGHFCGL